MRRFSRSAAIGVLALMLMAIAPDAQSQSSKSSRMGSSRSSLGSPSRSLGRSSGTAARGLSRSRAVSPSYRTPSRGARPGRIATPPRAGDRSSPSYGRGGSALGDILREGLNDRAYDRDRGRDLWDYLGDREDARADAYRDALIAETIVRVVGIIASNTMQPPPPHAAPAPAGHYETRRTLVREGYWESQQVWVPEQRDPTTGVVVEGHYQVHKRWVPEVYEETQVWVPHQTPLR